MIFCFARAIQLSELEPCISGSQKNKFGLCDYMFYICGMKILILLFLVCIFGCSKQIVDCECNDGIVFEDTRDTSFCSKPYQTIEYIYYLECDVLKSRDTIIMETHKGFKRFIIRDL